MQNSLMRYSLRKRKLYHFYRILNLYIFYFLNMMNYILLYELYSSCQFSSVTVCSQKHQPCQILSIKRATKK